MALWRWGVSGRSAVVAVVCAVALVGTSMGASSPSTHERATAASPTEPVLATSVLSLRRVPELLARTVATSRLDAGIDAALADPHLGAVAANSCQLVQVGGTTIYSRNPTGPLLPASNLKVLTMTAALDKLQPTGRLLTTVKTLSPPDHGTVAGDLYLVGGGDPLLLTPDFVARQPAPVQVFTNLDTLADQVRSAGVTTVTGSVVGDESRYDTQRYVPTWPFRYVAAGEVGPLSALEVDDGLILPPAPSGTGTSGPPSDAGPSAASSAASTPQPARQASSTFTTLLGARGITVTGAPRAATAPPNAVTLTQLASAPLGQVVDEILRRSDNNGAELITKELGRQANGATATTAAGVAVIGADLASDGLPTAGLHMVDGSGLDRSDRATCQLILAALLRSGPDGTLGQGLPVAGTSGTLLRRMVATPAAGRLRAKTGSLDGVSALSGFVTAAPGGAAAAPATTTTVAFSLIFNAVPTTAAGDALGDRIGVLLAQFPHAPPIADLAPLPTP